MADITQIVPNYLETLDFVDIKNLHNTSKLLSKVIGNNGVLRTVLYSTIKELYLPKNSYKFGNNVLNFPANYDIYGAMNDLDNAIEKLIRLNYPLSMYYPRWVNRELLIQDLKKIVFWDVLHAINEKLEESIISNSLIKLKKINVDEALLSFPLIAKGGYRCEQIYETKLSNVKLLDPASNKLVLPESFVDYIKFVISYFDSIDDLWTDNYMVDLIAELMFIRNHTTQSLG